jgi:integrase
MTGLSVLEAAGRRRSPATMPGYHAGRAPHNKGIRYPADPPTVEEIVAVMRHAADDRHGFRLRAMIVVLWRAGLRVQEALALVEHDLDARRGSVLVRNGKAAGARSAWTSGAGSSCARGSPPDSSCRRAAVLHHRWPHAWTPVVGRGGRSEFRRLPAGAGVRRRFAPHQLRHAHALELAREDVPPYPRRTPTGSSRWSTYGEAHAHPPDGRGCCAGTHPPRLLDSGLQFPRHFPALGDPG